MNQMRQVESAAQSSFGLQNDWQAGEAVVQWAENAHEVVCITTPNYVFQWRGRVNYSNFAEDYQYHGERLLPPDEPVVSAHLTLYREPVPHTAQHIRRGDVMQSLSGNLAQVVVAQPVREYQELSVRALQAARHRHWQRWVFAKFLRLDFDLKE